MLIQFEEMLQNNQENNPKIFSDISVLDADVMCYDDDDRNVVIVFSLVFFSADLPVSLFFVLLPFESFLSLSHTPSNFLQRLFVFQGALLAARPSFSTTSKMNSSGGGGGGRSSEASRKRARKLSQQPLQKPQPLLQVWMSVGVLSL